ncbi:MAG TPA: hypothetical protein VMU83_22295 [Hanamia sp.]|nr:hypothetical protein [Hanamia sp.]
MFNSAIPKLFFISLLAIFTISASAQKDYFIYLQTEGGQPFYAKFNNKLISSSSEGYLILSGVTDGVYNLVVGFPRNEFPEENFTISVDNKNEGLVLKNFDEKGWQLFNLQTLDLIKGTKDAVTNVPVKKDENAFTKMLAGVVKDSSILQNHEVLTAPVKSLDTSKALNSLDTPTVTAINNAKASLPNSDSLSENKVQPEIVDQPKPEISKILSVQDNNGLQMIYKVKSDSSNNSDTVRVFMPAEKNQPDTSTEKSVSVENKSIPLSGDASQPAFATAQIKSQTDSSSVPVIDIAKKNNSLAGNNIETPQILSASQTDSNAMKINDSSIANNTSEKNNAELPQNETITNYKDSSSQNNNGPITQITDVTPVKAETKTKETPPENQLIVLPKEVTSSSINSDCKEFATTEDFFKLRKRMAAVMDMDDMLRVAKKYFKEKCYSTAQIKDLSYLFLTEEGKYKFFDEAYAFTSDSDQYPTLQSQFKDPYYLNRFKAMIRK